MLSSVNTFLPTSLPAWQLDFLPAKQRPLFWEERAARLQSEYDFFQKYNDSANMLACFGPLARLRFERLSRLHGFEPARKSIVSAFQPKSGGTFLHNRLLSLGYQEFWWFFPHQSCHSVCYASDEALQLFLSGGCTCHSHARPDPNILAALDRAGVKKIWVHLRNPAASVVSAYHHFRGEGQGEGAIGEQRRSEALAAAPQQGVTLDSGVDDYVRAHLDWHIDWVARWLRFDGERPGLVAFSFHHELANPQALLARVLTEFGVELKGKVSAAPTGDDRYRRKPTQDWRFELTTATQRYLEERVRSELSDFRAFESLWN